MCRIRFGDALGAKTYAGYFEQEFMDSVNAFGIDMDYRYQASMYRSGKYTDMILKAIVRRREIYDILSRHRTQPATEAERNEFYPVSIYCAPLRSRYHTYSINIRRQYRR